jgi:hypothetical protein
MCACEWLRVCFSPGRARWAPWLAGAQPVCILGRLLLPPPLFLPPRSFVLVCSFLSSPSFLSLSRALRFDPASLSRLRLRRSHPHHVRVCVSPAHCRCGCASAGRAWHVSLLWIVSPHPLWRAPWRPPSPPLPLPAPFVLLLFLPLPFSLPSAQCVLPPIASGVTLSLAHSHHSRVCALSRLSRLFVVVHGLCGAARHPLVF